MNYEEVLNLALVFRFFDLHMTSPYLFQQDTVIMRNGSKFPNVKFPNFLNKFRKPNVETFRKAEELLSVKKNEVLNLGNGPLDWTR